MSGFLYYLPGAQRGPELRQRVEHCLPWAFEGAFTPAEVRGGPDGGSGLLLMASGPQTAQDLGYYPERQKWVAAAGQGGWWLGHYADRPPPGPEDLIRGRTHEGYPVQLRDGRAWTAPLVRAQIEGADGALEFISRLDRLTELDASGRLVTGPVIPEQAWMWELATAWWDAKLGAELNGDRAILRTLDDLHAAAARLLAVNYRVGPMEIASLGLFSERVEVEILDAAVDWPRVKEYLEKKVRGALPES